jgi:hypothetical protein
VWLAAYGVVPLNGLAFGACALWWNELLFTDEHQPGVSSNKSLSMAVVSLKDVRARAALCSLCSDDDDKSQHVQKACLLPCRHQHMQLRALQPTLEPPRNSTR